MRSSLLDKCTEDVKDDFASPGVLIHIDCFCCYSWPTSFLGVFVIFVVIVVVMMSIVVPSLWPCCLPSCLGLFRIAEMLHHIGDDFVHLLGRQKVQQPFDDDERSSVLWNIPQPSVARHGQVSQYVFSPSHVVLRVPLCGTIDALPQIDHERSVQVNPPHVGPSPDAQRAAVEPARNLQYLHRLVAGIVDKGLAPIVKGLCAACAEPYPPLVVQVGD